MGFALPPWLSAILEHTVPKNNRYQPDKIGVFHPPAILQQNQRHCCRHKPLCVSRTPQESAKLRKTSSMEKCDVRDRFHTTKNKPQNQPPWHEYSPSQRPKYLLAKDNTFARFRIRWRGTVFPTREFGRVVTYGQIMTTKPFIKN